MNYPPDGRRITMFDKDGTPTGHLEFRDAQEAFQYAAQRGLEAADAVLEAPRLPKPPASGPDMFGLAAPEPPPEREAEPTIKTDTRQIDMFGKTDAAVQAQANRDQQGRGGLEPKVEQKLRPTKGLFARQAVEQHVLFGVKKKEPAGPVKVSRWLHDRVMRGKARNEYTLHRSTVVIRAEDRTAGLPAPLAKQR